MRKRARKRSRPRASAREAELTWELGYASGVAAERYSHCPQCAAEELRPRGPRVGPDARAWECKICLAICGLVPAGREAEFEVPRVLERPRATFDPGEVRFFDFLVYSPARPSECWRHRGWYSTRTGRIVNLAGIRFSPRPGR